MQSNAQLVSQLCRANFFVMHQTNQIACPIFRHFPISFFIIIS
nr:MAG TPA: hypothetical protein [Caudoviricetes sp.]